MQESLRKNSINSIIIWGLSPNIICTKPIGTKREKTMDKDIIARIGECYPSLTKKQKQIADYMRDNIETMAYITLRDLSEELGITEMTILNTCKALGYERFNEVKYQVRKYINENRRIGLYQEGDYFPINVPEEELSDKEKVLNEICMEERGLMEEYTKSFDSRHIMQVAKLFFAYSKVILCGRGFSHILCQWMSSDLASAQVVTMLMNTELNESVYSILPAIDQDTLVVIVSFPDYYFVTDYVAKYAKKKGAKVVVITDSEAAKAAQYADELLLARSDTRLFLNTGSVPMALINQLVSAVRLEAGMEEKKDIVKTDVGKEFAEVFE